jgi:HEAT repeat protein
MNSLEQLREDLQNPRKSVRRNAAEALGKFGESALDTLISALPESDDYTCRRILEAMGSTGSPHAVTTIAPFLHDESIYVRKTATAALGKIHDKTVIPILIETLREPELQQIASHALHDLRDVATDALDLLVKAVQDPDPAVRTVIAMLLIHLDTPETWEAYHTWCKWQGFYTMDMR